MDDFSGFSAAALTFLRQLKRHNDREWFQGRKEEFDQKLMAPMKVFVEEMDVRLATLAPELHGSPKRSIFRIYRDTRFSKDKTPYKTHLGCWFTHVRAGHGVGSETHGAGAGFYCHFEPGASVVAGGIWMPPRESLARIRQRIAEAPDELASLMKGRTLRARYGSLSEEGRLTRVPRGFAADHPAAQWLRHSSFTVSAPLTDHHVMSSSLPQLVTRDFKTLLPLVRWLNSALGYPPQQTR